jgi:hypothetical protein
MPDDIHENETFNEAINLARSQEDAEFSPVVLVVSTTVNSGDSEKRDNKW